MTINLEIELSEEQVNFLNWLVDYDNNDEALIDWDINREVKVLALMNIDDYINLFKRLGLYKSDCKKVV